MVIENLGQCEEAMRALSEYFIKTTSENDMCIYQSESKRCNEEVLNHITNRQPVDMKLMSGLAAGAVILKDFPGMIQLWLLSKISDSNTED